MAMITITGKINNSQDDSPSVGATITFTLSDYYIAADGDIVIPKPESATVSNVDGTFSIQLESTEDGTPTSRYFAVQFDGTIDGTAISKILGTFTLPATPTSRNLKDLLIAGIQAAPITLTFVDKEIPSGTINGTNAVFTTSQTPISGSDYVFLNGILQRLTIDYTISSQTITFVLPPQVGDTIRVSYRKSP